MVMDRDSKLAAARKKLAKFQESKTVTVGQTTPKMTDISRDVVVNPTFTEGQSNGNHAASTPLQQQTISNGSYSSYSATGSSLSALQQVELEATRNQLQEQADELNQLKADLEAARVEIEKAKSQAVEKEEAHSIQMQEWQTHINNAQAENRELQTALENAKPGFEMFPDFRFAFEIFHLNF